MAPHLDEGSEDSITLTACNKDTREKSRLQKWMRGVWFCVSGSGRIQMWQPLYKWVFYFDLLSLASLTSLLILIYRSEGPAQVFLLVLTWLVAAFGKKTREDWKKVIVSYYNMCHLNNLKVFKRLLPLPGDLAYIWHNVTQIIDSLHLRNHKDQRC